MEHLLDCNFRSPIPVLEEFPESALPIPAEFLKSSELCEVFEHKWLHVKFPLFNVIIVLDK